MQTSSDESNIFWVYENAKSQFNDGGDDSDLSYMSSISNNSDLSLSNDNDNDINDNDNDINDNDNDNDINDNDNDNDINDGIKKDNPTEETLIKICDELLEMGIRVKSALPLFENGHWIVEICVDFVVGEYPRKIAGYDIRLSEGSIVKCAMEPLSVGEHWCNFYLKTKSYTKHGESCQMCFKPIFHKINCWTTYCGHVYHRKCLSDANHRNMIENKGKQYGCSVCGKILNYDFSEYLKKYPQHDTIATANFIDHLENFWNCIEYINPQLCGHSDHYSGSNPSCRECVVYAKTGKSWIEQRYKIKI